MSERGYDREGWYPGERHGDDRDERRGDWRSRFPDEEEGRRGRRYDPAETGTGMADRGRGTFGRGYGMSGWESGREGEGRRFEGRAERDRLWGRDPWGEDDTWRAGGARGTGGFAPWGTSEGSWADTGRGGYGDRGYGSGSYGDEGRRPGAGYGSSGAAGTGYAGLGYGGTSGRPGYGGRSEPGEANLGGRFTGRGPKGYQRSRERILDDVCQRLADHPEIDASEMEVDVDGDVVVLRGRVHDRGQKRLAEDAAETVSGVRDIRNELDVEKGMLATLTDAVTGRSRDDEEIGDTHAAPRKAPAGSSTS